MISKILVTFIAIAVGFVAGKMSWNIITGNPATASFDSSDWTNQSYLGVTFESPFELTEMDVQLPFYMESYIRKMETFFYYRSSISMFVTQMQYKNKIPANIDEAVEGAVQNILDFEDISDFDYKVERITKYYLAGRKIVGTLKIEGEDAEFEAEIYTKDSKTLEIVCMNIANENNRAIKNRIISSLNVKL